MVLIILITSIFLVSVWFRHGLLLGTGESGLPFYNLEWQWEASNWAWKTPTLGNVNGIVTASSPTYWFLSRLDSFGLPNFAVQALFIFVCFSVAGVSIYYLTKELFPRLESKFLLLATFFYWFNPISLVNVWKRFLYNHMAFFAFLPLALLLFVKGIKNKDLRLSIAFGLLSGVFAYALNSPALNIVLWAVLTYTILFYLLVERRRRLFILKFFGLAALTYSLINLWWLSQLTSFLFSPAFGSSVSSFFTLTGNLSTLTSLSRRLGQLVDITRLMHGTFYSEGPIWARAYLFPGFVLLQFTTTGVIFWTILKFRKIIKVLFLGVLFVGALFLTSGNNPPFGELFQLVFTKVQPFQVFRNPFEKFGFLLPLATAPLFAFGLERVTQLQIGKRLKKIILVGSFAYVLVFWGFPFWSGLVFTSSEGYEGDRLESYRVKVPKYYKNANEWIKKQGDNFRFISLPLGGEGITYAWEKPYSGIELSSILFEIPNISFNTTIPFYNDFVSEISRYQLDSKLLSFVPFMNGKYIVWRGDIDFKQRRMANPEVVKRKLDEWINEGLITKRFEVGELIVYEVTEKLSWPKIYIAREVLATNDDDLAEISNFSWNFPEKKIATVNARHLEENVPYSKIIIKPKGVFTQKVTSPIPQDLTEENLLSKLFHAKHLPDRWYYPLVRVKERIEEVSQDDYFGRVLYGTGILGKRAVEVYKLREAGAKREMIVKAEKDYERTLEKTVPTLLGFVDNSSPVSKVVRDSLLYQWILLDRAGSKAAEGVAELLINWGIKPKFELPVSDKDYIIFSFEIAVPGKYKLEGDKTQGLFLDGESSGDTDFFELSSGEHEIAFQPVIPGVFPTFIEEESLLLSEKEPLSWEVDIADLLTVYRLEFEYRFIRGDSFDIEFYQDIDKDDSPIFSSGIRKDKGYHGWRHWEKEFTTSPGANSGILSVFAAAKEVCERQLLIRKVCNLEKQDFEVEIRSLTVSDAHLPEVFLVQDKGQPEVSETLIEFGMVNPTEYQVKVNKKDDSAEMLVFSELFSSNWEAKYEDGEKIPEGRHYLVNVYANGWLIEQPGKYLMTIKFIPQDLLEKGKKISTASFLGSLVLLGVWTWKRRKQ